MLVGLSVPVQAQSVTLRPGDALRVQIKNEPRLGGQFPVSTEGTVLLPLLGVIQVAERPFEEVRAELATGYTRELAEPEFLATPLIRVTVSGEVRSPGLRMAEPTLSIAELLAQSGGPLSTAKRNRVDLVRGGERRELDGSAGSLDLAMHPESGDELFVPRRGWFSDNLPILIGAAASVAAAAVTTLIVR
jgi:protein involved in polysaccharide export with SLBB domain